jgi:hypothetical protein
MSKLNKQIIEIAVDSGFDVKSTDSLNTNLDCFSRGIIRSCVANLRNHGYDDAAEQLSKHFGVE